MPQAGDPVALRSALLFRVFARYLRWYVRRNFHALRLAQPGLPPIPPGQPVIICTNHPSWWDPALFILLMPALFPGRQGFGPMEDAALRRYGVFRRLGVFGIDPHSRAGAARFLRTGQAILRHGRTVLWITAEGRFTDARQRPVRLRPGIVHLARQSQAAILPLAIEYPFWNERFPEALIRFGAPLRLTTGTSVTDGTAQLEAALTETMQALAMDAISRDPARFTTLIGGAAGVGGVYDLYRRIAGALAGRRFDPRHEGADP